MASSQNPPSTWTRFRFGSIARPVPLPSTKPPEPAGPTSPQPRLPLPRPFRPPTQTRETTAPRGVSSGSTSPIRRTSVPSSPVTVTTSPRSRTLGSSVGSVLDSPSPKTASASSLPNSPANKPASNSPIFKTASPSSLPTSPANKHMTTSPTHKTASPSSLPTSPAANPASRASPVMSTRGISPTPSPSTTRLFSNQTTPPHSPSPKPTAAPPSPLVLPPAQLRSPDKIQESRTPPEAEQKTVLVDQKTIYEKPKPSSHEKNSQDHHKHGNFQYRHEHHRKNDETEEKVHRSKKLSSSNPNEASMRIITLSGDNKGAIMEVIRSPIKHKYNGTPRTLYNNYKNAQESGWSSQSGSSDEGSGINPKKKDNTNGKVYPPMDAIMNSNVQGINNSIVFRSSCSHHDPGVHLALSRKPAYSNEFYEEENDNGDYFS